MANDNLRKAKATRDGEYYTQEKDVAAELKNYSTFLKDKVVFCNCDDPTWSNFWKYLHENFSTLGLKKLISTHYEPDGSPSYKMEYEGGDDLNVEAGTITPLIGNGDFRSEECIELLKESDVAITNPPFFLWIEYLNQLLEYDKKFIIIGNMNAAHNKDTFPLIRDNKIWCGTNSKGGTRKGNSLLFGRPEGAVIKNPVEFEGKILDQIASWWYTNVDIKKRHQPFFPPEDAHCYYEGNEDKYPLLDNYENTINVDKTEMIPIDWAGYLAVPISYLDKHNNDDFEIVGSTNCEDTPCFIEKHYKELGYKFVKADGITPSNSGALKDKRSGKIPGKGRGDYSISPDGACLHAIYSRIIIRNRHPISKEDDI